MPVSGAHHVLERGVTVRLDTHIQRERALAGGILHDGPQTMPRARQQQPALHETVEGHRRCAIEITAGGPDEVQHLLKQRPGAYRTDGSRLEQDGNVDFAPLQPIEEIARIGADDPYRGLGVAVGKGGDERNRENVRYRGRHADGHVSAQRHAIVGGLRADLIHLRHDALGMLEHIVPGGRQHHSPSVPGEAAPRRVPPRAGASAG